MLTARWRDTDGSSLEHCALSISDAGVVVDSIVIADTFGLRYRIACDAAWRTRAVDVELIGTARAVHLLADGAGGWWSEGASCPELRGAIDVDITATPLTNTLPIRRLPWRDGDAREITLVYVTVPEMTLTTSRQRYTKLTERRYRFEALESDFTRDLDVDEHGLVVHYPGLFERVGQARAI
jgi:hypothetical protein